MADVEVPVLIVGGGGAGLTASMLLSGLGVDALLVSALPTTSQLPKAHLLNQRSMEILEDAGVAQAIYDVGTPRHHMATTAFYAGFAGFPDAGRLMARLDAWGAGGADLDWESASPMCSANLPQIRLEPLMKKHAEALAPGSVRFGHEVTEYSPDENGVTVRVRDIAGETDYTVRARYVLACDGGRFVGPQLGVTMDGLRDVGQMVSMHMTADLSPWAKDPDVLIRWTWLPHMGKMATLVPMGPTRWGPESEEWVFHLNYTNEDPRSLDDAQVEADMRRALGIGDHPVDIHMITRWELMGVVASNLRVGRTFMLGDAAHRHPPTGGLGLTSATQDVHNLCWKLKLVLDGQAGDALLDSYEPERRSSVQWNVNNSLDSALNHIMTGEALGLTAPDLSPEEGWDIVRRLWSTDPADAEYRYGVRRAIARQSMEFRKLNVEYGYRYVSDAIVSDGTPDTETADHVRIYEPSTRPGHPLPHAWVEGASGERVSTLHLVRPGRFLLIVGEDAQGWRDAGRRVAREAGIPLDVVAIGQVDGDYFDVQSTWQRYRGITSHGCVLVRPDRFVTWRANAKSTDAAAELVAVFQSVLAQPLSS